MESARVLLGCPAAFPPLWQQRVEWQLQATGSMGGFSFKAPSQHMWLGQRTSHLLRCQTACPQHGQHRAGYWQECGL
eukprot:9134587-Prorocentrum_lima.AAC.1